jgi:hypothetical protein
MIFMIQNSLALTMMLYYIQMNLDGLCNIIHVFMRESVANNLIEKEEKSLRDFFLLVLRFIHKKTSRCDFDISSKMHFMND